MNKELFMQELREKREEYGISQSRFAVACGISREYYNRIENGKTPLTEELKQEITKQLERFNPDEPLFLLIDYFRVRFLTTDALTVIKNVLHIKVKHMRHEDYEKYGYEVQYFTGNIVLLVSFNPALGVAGTERKRLSANGNLSNRRGAELVRFYAGVFKCWRRDETA